MSSRYPELTKMVLSLHWPNMVDDERDPRLVAIGERVRQQRRAIGLTQETLASRAELSKSHLSEIESGVTGAAGLIYLRLADALEMPIQWLLTGQDPPVAAPGPPKVLPEVSVVADAEGWTHRRAIDISVALIAVHARRTAGGARRGDYSREEIVRIAEALGDPEEETR